MTVLKPVLVTGGAGYIGSHTCKTLSESGYYPITFDNMTQGHEWAVQWGPLVRGELSDRDLLRKTIIEYKPEAVLHFAAMLSVGESVENPALYYRNNVFGTMDLLDVMRECGLTHLVFSSTAAVYGNPHETPITETHPTLPTNPYGSTKLTVEQILSDYATAYGLNSIALRYFNAAGADPDGKLGEAHEPETHLIPLVLEAAMGMREHISVFGNDYDTPDGTCIRDYIHVSDLADAHVLALKSLGNTDPSLCTHYNLGNGQGFSVLEIIKAAEKITGQTIPVYIANRRAGDPAILVADSSKTRKQLGWSPKYSDINLQIAHAWDWYNSSKP